jgi:ubiquinone biosynthesis protein
LKKKLIPTPLVEESERPPLLTEEARPPGWGGVPLSVVYLVRFIGLLLLLRFRRDAPRDKALRVRKFLEQRGGLWVKAAQVLASRQDAMPKVYCNEFGRLFDSATAFPGEQSRRVIEESLGRPITEVFSEFSDEAIAAASIGQTHRARLRWNNALVAVKVRRPYAEARYKRDLKLVKVLLGFLDRLAVLSHVRPLEMYAELETMLREELDYRIEATSIGLMRRTLKADKVYAPRAFLRFCTRDVLVMSFVEGVLMSDYLKLSDRDPLRVMAWREENNVVPKKVARRIFMSSQRQLYEDNLFHADLHPGNIMLLRNSRFALLDFGSVGSLDVTFKNQLMLYNRLLTRGEMAKAIMLLIQMSSPVPRIDLALLVRRLVRLGQHSFRLIAAKNVPYQERIYSEAMSQQIRILGEARIPVSWEFLRAQRTIAVMEMSLRQLDPGIEPIKFARIYFRAADSRAMKGTLPLLARGLRQVVSDAGEVLQNLTERNLLTAKQSIDTLESRVARFIRHLIVLFRRGLVVATATLLVLLGLQHRPQLVPEAVKRWLSPLAEVFPRLGYPGWIVLFLATVVVFRTAGGIRRYFD